MQLADVVRRHELAIGGGAAFALAGSSMAVNRHCVPVHPTSQAGAAHRRQRAWTQWRSAMWDAGCRPTQMPELRSHCFCGAEIGLACEEHVYASHMEAA
jgi:hypothetical protein